MKIIKLILCGVVAALNCTAAMSQDTFQSLDEAKMAMSGIVAEYVTKDPNEAIRKLPRFSVTRTEEEQRIQIQKYVKWNAETSDKRGASLSYQFISAKTVGDAVARLRFLVLTERFPVTFDFFFYRKTASASWSLADLGLTSGPVGLFAVPEQ